MRKDPIVEEIRKLREAYAAKFNYDVDAIFRDLQESQKNSDWKVVRLKSRPAQSLKKPKKRKSSKVK